ncbi:uncharacterized protein LY89DRAFT_553410, partial [Mollisia scopiformis]
MSFGYSIGDALSLLNLAFQTLQNTRRACGEHDDLTREVSSLHRVLHRLHLELLNPHSVLNRADDDRHAELNELGESCEQILRLMNSIVTKYNALWDGSIWTNVDGDEKMFWRELRRGLVKEGYRSSVLQRHKHLIQDYIKEL